MHDAVSVDFFESALEEAGLTGANIRMYRDAAHQADVLQVRKKVGDEELGADHRITDRERTQIDDLKQHVATLAERTARSFEEHTTEQIEWGENIVKLDLTEDYTARCFRCGAEVSLNDVQEVASPRGEATVPRPKVDVYKSLPATKLRMIMLATLREECDNWCPNSPYDDQFARVDRKI